MMNEDNSPSFVFFLSCQLLTYFWCAPYGEDARRRAPRMNPSIYLCVGDIRAIVN
jgi:hypothetical protein